MANFVGTAGSDTIIGSSGADQFDMTQGGNDRVYGGGAGDVFFFGATLTASDRIDGGDGSDTLVLEGDYNSGLNLTLAPHTLKGIENVTLLGDFYYRITFVDENLRAGQTLAVVAAIGQDKSAFIDARAETGGSYFLSGSDGGDSLWTGGGDDVIYGGQGIDNIEIGLGTDTALGGDGDDAIVCGTGLDGNDRIDGGAGYDFLSMRGDFSVAFAPDTLLNIEHLYLEGIIALDFTASRVAEASRVKIVVGFGNAVLTAANVATSYGFDMYGGNANDTLIGSNGDDFLAGGRGADAMTGGDGSDTFFWVTVLESTGLDFDTITGFDANEDLIDVHYAGNPAIDGVESDVVGGRLNAENFDRGLKKAIGFHELGAHHAVLFMPDRGDFKNDVFLIVDRNGVGGYQANKDIVVRLDAAANLDDLGVEDF